MTNDEMFEMALKQALDKEIAECEKLPRHIFSRGFDRKMKRLFREKSAAEKYFVGSHTRRRLPIAIIIVIASFLLMGAAATTYYLWNNFCLQDRGLYTLLNITDVEDCPKTLEEHYRLTADLSGFTENVLSDDEVAYFAEYENKERNIKISFEQVTKRGLTIMLNTENMDPPVEVIVNDCNGIYYGTKYGSHVYIWDTGDYLIELGAYGIGKDELFSLTKFVKKVE